MGHVEGLIYQESGFIKGYLEFTDGIITNVGTGTYPIKNKPLAKGVILPLLTNYHTHIGDAIAHGRITYGNIESLVAPPNGLKFRILKESKPQDLINSMREAAIEMLNSGTATFCDFREEGLTGVEYLITAINALPINTIILGRPANLIYSKAELSTLLPKVEGIGISSISDWEYSELEKLASIVKQEKKLFALHACERMHEDMDKILDLKPDFLIHMTYGTEADFEKLSELEIPVVLCIRTNIFFNNLPNISKMLNNNVTLVLGTDNAMINNPNLFDEAKVCFEYSNKKGTLSPETLLKMLTLNLKKILNPNYYISLAPGTPSNFMVLNIPLSKPELTIAYGIKPENIKLISIGTKIWKC